MKYETEIARNGGVAVSHDGELLAAFSHVDDLALWLGDQWRCEWIDHDGGECPIGGSAIVDVEFRDGSIDTMSYAEDWDWPHDDTSHDIMRYRIIAGAAH